MTSAIQTIPLVTPPYPFEAYSHIISPLPPEEGGGFLVTLPDLPGCLGDGATEAEAVAEAREAFVTVVSALHDMGREIPAPTFQPEDAALPAASGKFVTRVPKSVHARLASRAKSEGVSLNSLVVALLAEGLGRREHVA